MSTTHIANFLFVFEQANTLYHALVVLLNVSSCSFDQGRPR